MRHGVRGSPFRVTAQMLVFATLFTLIAVACRRSNAEQEVASATGPRTEPECRFDVADGKNDTVFLVLGMLDEYLGRQFVEDDDRVERFYPHEQQVAEVFQRLLVKLAKEQGLQEEARKEVVAGGLVFFYSRQIADRLNSCYTYQLSTGSMVPGSDGKYKRAASGSLQMSLFMKSARERASDELLSRRRALAYITGAWLRYGRGSDLVFANAHDKAMLIAQLLTMLGCRNVRLESTFGQIPQTNTVRFDPSEELSSRIENAPS
jgi:hypothetical protein